jgi:signal peptidase I
MPSELAWYKSLRTALFSFKGRLSLGRFWEYAVLTNILSGILIFAISVVLFQIAEVQKTDGNDADHAPISAIVIAVVLAVTLLWSQFALLWKRFHDRGRPGWFALLTFIPILGFLWMAVDAYILPGKAEANRYGPVPDQVPRSGIAEFGLVSIGIGVLILIAVLGRAFIMEPFNVPSGSNEPTIAAGDTIAVSRYAYRLGGPQRGDYAVFINPHTGEDYVKRIVGLPGDTVQLRQGIVLINGEAADRKRVDDYKQRAWNGTLRQFEEDNRYRYRETLPGGPPHEILGTPTAFPEDSMPQDTTQIFKVPSEHFFAIGDNRDNSNDSRLNLGYVPLSNLVGRVEFVYLSQTPGKPNWNIFGFLASIRWSRMLRTIR